MHCPTLAELPPPPPGKSGWPWTVESPQLPETTLDGRRWPSISIVTPSYNQGEFIEETIRSVLLQGYPNLEYIIIDGGSRDGSTKLIKKYQKWLTGWVSEQDRGQPHALNKGFKSAGGEILQWTNSDDLLLPGALEKIGFSYSENFLLVGDVIYFGAWLDESIRKHRALSAEGLIMGHQGVEFHQPGIWFNGRKVKELGGMDEAFQYAFDWHFLIKYLDRWPEVNYLDEALAKFRLHEQSKTVSRQQSFQSDRVDALRRLIGEDLGQDTMKHCMNRVAIQDWWDYLDDLKRVRGRPTAAVMQIILAAFSKPKLRLNKFTLGAIRTILKR